MRIRAWCDSMVAQSFGSAFCNALLFWLPRPATTRSALSLVEGL